MKRSLLSIGPALLALGGGTIGPALLGGGAAQAGTRSPADMAKRAGKAIDRHDPAAVTLAEEVVATVPSEAAYRALLGRAYLQAGRFASARDAFADALRLRPADGRSALNLALATVATGDWQGARAVLAANEGGIAVEDRGLALALAGDPAGGVALLMQAAREPGTTSRTRQNLALALALSGQWPLARAVAAVDVSPAELDGRIAEWARFAQPAAASDQVAALLGVQAVADGGMPVALALASPPAPVLAVAAPVTVAAPVSAPMVAAAPVVTFGPRREVVQALPSATPHRGGWHVQLGAYNNAALAEDAWARMRDRYAAIAHQRPHGSTARGRRGALYRLSVGGFDREGAERLCSTLRGQGGRCFVRRAAGDAVAQWDKAEALAAL